MSRWIGCFTVIAVLFLPALANAQNQGGGGGGGGGNQGGGNNQNNQNRVGGIVIDANGIVAPGFAADQSSRLDKKRQQASAAKLIPGDVNRVSACRKVSLVELEKLIADRLNAGARLSDEVRRLAGLQRIDYVFVDPDGKDLILAGPADGFAPDATGRMRGLTSGRPTLLLDDLLVAVRFVPRSRAVGCTIDPRPANLSALQRYVAQNSTPASPQQVEARYHKMAEILGLHDVRVDGVPADSHFGRVLVEADYRMKRIALGLENPGVKGLRSHLSYLNGGGNTIQRWWFVPLYDSLTRSQDGLAFHFAGQRAQLMSQDEVANLQGERSAAATTRLTTQAFAKNFTEKFAALADESPVFAELQNLIDWCVVTALIERERVCDKLGWSWGMLADAERLPYEVGIAPKEVPAMMNFKRASAGTIIGQVAGGISVHPQQLASPQSLEADKGLRLDGERTAAIPSTRPTTHPWWWD